MHNIMGLPMITDPVTFYLWIRAVPVLAAAALFLLAGVTAIFSRGQLRRNHARAVLALLADHRTIVRRKPRRLPSVISPFGGGRWWRWGPICWPA
jgi:hypothetical protein